MTEPIVIASWPKNARETLQVSLTWYHDRPIVDCRDWYMGADGALKPGRSGLTVSIRHLPQLAEALAKAVETAAATGLLTEHSAQSDS